MRGNCLIEAIKAKIKDPKNVSIVRLPSILNYGHPHYIWFDKKDNKVHHFTSVGKSNHIYFNGIYKTLSLEAFETWALFKLIAKKNKLKIAKKLHLKSADILGTTKFVSYFPSLEDESVYVGNLPSLEDAKYLEKVLKREVQIKVFMQGKMYIMSTEEVLKADASKGLSWKYITLFDADYDKTIGEDRLCDKFRAGVGIGAEL